MKLEYIERRIGSMSDINIGLLETVAIRYAGHLDYKAVKELTRFPNLMTPCYISINSLQNMLKNTELSNRTSMLVEDCIKNADKIKHSVENYARIVEKEKIEIIPSYDPNYPYEWKYITGMPEIIFTKGNKDLLDKMTIKGSVSIVGSRKPGRYAEYATEEFSKTISHEGIIIVSGMALGIDAAAHRACINESGSSIAVLPCGVDNIYPYKNHDIYENLCANGLVLSELPPGEPVIKQYFPARNRLISALSDACLIMEAGMYSGTLHTASFAASQGKDVFVLPNSIYSENSIGGLELLRDGAEVLIDSDTVIDRVRGEIEKRKMLLGDDFCEENSNGEKPIEVLRNLSRKNKEGLSEDEWKRILLDEISIKPVNIDDLVAVYGLPISFIASLVSELEIKGMVENTNGKYVLTIPKR